MRDSDKIKPKKFKYSEDLEYEMEQIWNKSKDKDKGLQKANRLWKDAKK